MSIDRYHTLHLTSSQIDLKNPNTHWTLKINQALLNSLESGEDIEIEFTNDEEAVIYFHKEKYDLKHSACENTVSYFH